MEKIAVAVKKPRKDVYYEIIDNTLEALQEIVGGWIEVVPFGDKVVICDEEGRLKGKEPNCSIAGVSFVGTIVVAGTDGENFTSL